jgi:hypothetical protein
MRANCLGMTALAFAAGCERVLGYKRDSAHMHKAHVGHPKKQTPGKSRPLDFVDARKHRLAGFAAAMDFSLIWENAAGTRRS